MMDGNTHEAARKESDGREDDRKQDGKAYTYDEPDEAIPRFESADEVAEAKACRYTQKSRYNASNQPATDHKGLLGYSLSAVVQLSSLLIV